MSRKSLFPREELDYKLEGAILKKEGYRHISARIETIKIILEDILLKTSEEHLKELGRLVAKAK
ncbi:MAG: hypothetical protein QXS66_07550 [Thermoproteota archaeon]